MRSHVSPSAASGVDGLACWCDWRQGLLVRDVDDLDDVLSADEAAALLKVPPATVRREARAGRLPGRHVGKEWRFARSALIDWLRGELEASGVGSERYTRGPGAADGGGAG